MSSAAAAAKSITKRTRISSIDALNSLISQEGFDPKVLEGKLLADGNELSFDDDVYVEGTRITGRVTRIGGGVTNSKDNTMIYDLVDVVFSQAPPSNTPLAGRLVLRAGDDAVVGVLITRKADAFCLVPLSDLNTENGVRSFIEPNPEYKPGTKRPRMRYGSPVSDPSRQKITQLYAATV